MPGSDVTFNPTYWTSFLSAQVSASAALTGLLFVAVSINLPRIIASPHLTPRVGKALVTLIGILFVTSLCLVPAQPKKVLGTELIVLGVGVWISLSVLQRGHARGNPYISGVQKTCHALLAQMSAIPIVVCGVSMLFAAGGGLYWLVVAVVFSFVSALLDAWVLLIEIQR